MTLLRLNLLLLIATALCAQGVLADVYKYRDSEGRIYLTDKPMKGPYRLLQRFRMPGTRSSGSAGAWAGMERRRKAMTPLIEQAANASSLRPALVHAVVRAESSYRADAVSSKGAMGLMQLMPATAERFGVSDAYDPQQNLRGGTRYLRQLLEMFDQDLRLALAAYNAGENAVLRYGRQIPPFPETQDYVEKVMRFYQEMRSSGRLAQNG